MVKRYSAKAQYETLSEPILMYCILQAMKLRAIQPLRHSFWIDCNPSPLIMVLDSYKLLGLDASML